MARQAAIDKAPTSDKKTVRYRPRGRVLPAEEVAAWETGRSYLEAAEREAERLREDAVSAFEDAKRRGFEEGRKDGAEAAARLLAETAGRADRQLREADRQIIDLALAVLRRVLGDLDIGKLLTRAVQQALISERRDRQLTLHVAPDMVDRLRADLDGIVDPDMRHLITVEPDAKLLPGDCRLASAIGFVDLGIEAQLTALHQGLVDGLNRRTEG
ncbi:MAG: type III secretion system stator protein SctL [Geminicoccaceae bacterium]